MTGVFKKAYNYLTGSTTKESDNTNTKKHQKIKEKSVTSEPELFDSNLSLLKFIKVPREIDDLYLASSSSDSESDMCDHDHSSFQVESIINQCNNECANIKSEISDFKFDIKKYPSYEQKLHKLLKKLDTIDIQNYEEHRIKLKLAVKLVQNVEKQLRERYRGNQKENIDIDVGNINGITKVEDEEEGNKTTKTSLKKVMENIVKKTIEVDKEEERDLPLSGLLALHSDLQHLVPALKKSDEKGVQVQSKFASKLSNTDSNSENLLYKGNDSKAKMQELDFLQRETSKMHGPIQLLIQINKEKCVLNEDALRSILFREDVKNRRIVLVSVVGRFRRGKSFLLNFMRRYLHAQGSSDWMTSEDPQTLEGFHWRGGSSRETSGIMLWPEPFLVSNDIAVLLLDTQGTFDGQTSQRMNSFIFAISTMLSSVQIYNVSEFIQMDDFTNLQAFLEFGKLIMEQCNEKAFQKLIVLVRDWKFPDEKKYGLAGGQELLNEWMRNDEGEVTKEITEMLTSCFDSISCFLLPYPGDNVSKYKEFKGDLNGMTTEFKDCMANFIEAVLAPRNLTPKRIGGNEIQAKDLLNFAKMCVEELQKNELKAETILEEAARVEHTKYVHDSIEFYEKEMETRMPLTEDIETLHKIVASKALEMYDLAKKFGGTDITTRYKDTLIQEINHHYEEKVKSYMRKVKLEKQSIVDKSFRKARQTYRYNIDKFIREADFSTSLLSQHNQWKIEAIRIFYNETLENISEEDLSIKMNDLDKRMNEIYELHHKDYEIKQNEAAMKLRDEEFRETLTLAVFKYHKLMEEECGGEKICNNITDAHTYATGAAVEEIHNLNDKYNKQHDVKKYEDEFIKTVNKEFLTYSKINEEKKIENEERNTKILQTVKKSAIEVYERCMQTLNTCKTLTVNQLSLQHKNAIDIVKKEVFEPVIKKVGKEKSKSYIKEAKDELKHVTYANYRLKCNIDNSFEQFIVFYKAQLATTYLGKEIYTRKQHEKIREDYCKQFKSSCFQGSYFQDKINELPMELDKVFEAYQKESIKNEAQIKLQKQNDVFEQIKVKYKKDLEKLRVGEEYIVNLDGKLDELQNEIEIKFQNNTKDMSPSLRHQWSKLIQQMDDEFQTLKTRNEDVKPVDELEKAYNNGIMVYETEMNELLSSQCPDSIELKKYHESVTKSAIQSFRATPRALKITEIMEGDFRETLQNLFEKFEVKCSLKQREQRMQLPSNSNAKSYAVGIDLGTTFSCAAVYRDDKVELIRNKDKQKTTPSVVYIDDFKISVGESATHKGFNDPENCITEIKRIIGRPFDDPIVQELKKMSAFKLISKEEMPVIEVTKNNHNKYWKPEEVSAEVLKELKRSAELHLDSPVHDAVVTIPAYFTEPQRTATITACKLAGLNVLRLLNEPTAAAITYGLQKMSEENRNVLVFDFGGGTCDVSILRVKAGEFKVLASNGDNKLGGEDFDDHLMKYVIQKVEAENEVHFNPPSQRRLKFKCELAKRRLTDSPEYTINLVQCFGDEDLEFSIKRSDFEEICENLFKRALEPVETCLMEANLEFEQIDEIVLAGGSSRLPKIREMLTEMFNGKELNCSINPDEAIAHGAAIEAALLTKECKSDIKINDITPFSLGIALIDGTISYVIPKNSPIPFENTEKYKTTYNLQHSMQFEVYQGENSRNKKANVKLGEFTLTNIRAANAGEVTALVTFIIDANGILQVTAEEESRHKKKKNKISVVIRKVC